MQRAAVNAASKSGKEIRLTRNINQCTLYYLTTLNSAFAQIQLCVFYPVPTRSKGGGLMK